MGTTLTNGIYLPNEGEKNCYAGLKTNWEILDQKVADITALQQAVAGALHREIVESLPTTDIDLNTIYMVLSGTSATENVYNEFMYVNNAWELIGTSATDLTNYYTKAEVDGKLLLKANASDLTSHTGDSTIHVTANDKDKWTNSANTHVLRLAKSALTPSSSTNAFSNLDDSTALKAGDKVMDTAGVLFEVTAIDTANSTFTIGTALIDLALDSDVMHLSGDETVGGIKTFSNDTYIKSLNFTNEVASPSSSSGAVMPIITTVTYTDQTASTSARINLRITASGDKSLYPHENNQYALGLTSRKWSEVHGVTYYYGSSDVEFSTKFVTTDTVQDVTANKNFKGLITTKPDSTLWPATANTTDDITLLDGAAMHIEYKSSGQLSNLSGGAWGVAELGYGCFFFRINNGKDIRFKSLATGDVNRIPVVSGSNRFINDVTPDQDNTYNLGNSSLRWRSINGINPGSLSLPDLSNGIDISGYITVNGGNKESLYTPTVDGWISVALTRTSGNVGVMLKQGNLSSSGHRIEQENGTVTCNAMLPVKGGVQVSINANLADSVVSAYFYPCQGNV